MIQSTEWQSFLSSAKRIVCVHPYTSQHRQCLESLLAIPGAAYLGLADDVRSLSDLEDAFQHAVGLVENTPVRLIVIDEYSSPRHEDLAELLVKQLGKSSTQFVLFCRYIPSWIMTNEKLKNDTQIYPVDPVSFPNYLASPTDQTLVEVNALGAGWVLVDGQPIPRWEGGLPQALFFYCIDRGIVTREEIFSTFWQGFSKREATNVFHVTKRKIHELLGVDLLVYRSGYYQVSPEIDLRYDVRRFSEYVQQSLMQPRPQAIETLQSAIHSYHGAFLQRFDMPWVTKRRMELEQAYGDALITLAEYYDQVGNAEAALGIYLRSLQVRPVRAYAVEQAMRLYLSLDMPFDAMQVFENFRTRTHVNLPTSAHKELKALYQQATAASAS